jgi:predicted MFS family arabinose efflux permease
VAVAVTLFATHESRDETAPRRVDVPGIATLTAGLTALVLALVEANAWGWGSARIVALFAISVAGLIGFVLVERRSPVPVVDFRFFASRSFVGANLVAFAVTFAMFAMFFFLALYLQNILGYSPLETGWRFLPTTLIIIAAGPIAGRFSDRIGPRPLIVAGLVAIAASLAWLSRIQPDTSYGYLLPGFMVMGVGMGLVMSPMSTAAMNAVDKTKAGVASGTLSMVRMVGGTFGVAALGALVAAIGRHDLERALPQLPAGARERLVDGLGSGVALNGAPAPVRTAATTAFVDALGTGLTIAAASTLLSALVAFWLIGARPAAAPVETAAEAVPA